MVMLLYVLLLSVAWFPLISSAYGFTSHPRPLISVAYPYYALQQISPDQPPLALMINRQTATNPMILPTGFSKLHIYLVDDLGPMLRSWREDAYADETWNGYKAWLAPSVIDNIIENVFAFEDDLSPIYTAWNNLKLGQQFAILADVDACLADSLCPA